MKVLVTGGLGFIGSHITEALLEEGHELMVMDNLLTGKRQNLIEHPRLLIKEGTIIDEEFVLTEISSFLPDVIIHAAASFHQPDEWLMDINNNIIGTVHVVNAAKQTGVKKIIYLQTSLSYGLNPLEQPITINHPLFSGKFDGGSSYAITKTAGEQFIKLSGIDFVSFRLSNIYGPRNLTGPIPLFYKNIIAGEMSKIYTTSRDFLFVSDLVRCIVKSISAKNLKLYYHLSTGKDCSIESLFFTMGRLLGKTKEELLYSIEPMIEGDVRSILLDPSFTQTDFGWSADTPLEIGLQETIQWYKNNSIEKTYSHLKLHK